MVTTNLFTHPVFKDGAFTANDRDVRRYAIAQGAAQHRPGRRARREDVRGSGAAARAPSPAPARTSHAALDRFKEALRPALRVRAGQGYDIRFALEPKPNEPRGDILLPTVGHALAFIERAGAPRAGRRQPGGRARADGRAQLRARHRPGAVGTASSSTSTSTASTAAVRPGPALRRRQPARARSGPSTCSRAPAGPARLRRTAALRLQAAAHRGRSTASGRRRAGVHAQLPVLRRSGPRRSGPTPRSPRRWPRPGSPALAAAHPRRRRGAGTS